MLWRILFILYALSLTVATHWPRLDLGRGGGERAPDKMLHFAAFAALTFMLWRTKWLTRRALIVLVALTWATLDELSQHVAMIERTASWADWVASAAGVLTVGAWLWALEPVGGAMNRLRLARSALATDRVLGSPAAIAMLAAGAAVGAAGGMLVVLIVRQISDTRQLDATLLTLLAGAGAGAHWMFVLLQRREIAAINDDRACFTCGKRIEQPACEPDGMGACADCGGAFHIGQWSASVLPSNASPLKSVLTPALVTLGLMIAGGIAFLLIMRLTITVPSVSRVVRALNLNTAEMMLVGDVAYLAIAIAVGTRLFRRKLARVYDRQGKVCAQCGHDLRATPVILGAGTCGECGMKFMRIAENK